MQNIITILPDICNGKPTIRGMRITVRSILEHLAAGDSYEDILAAYPFLKQEDIQACLGFAAQIVDREAIIYKLAS